MTRRRRWILLAAVTVLALAGSLGYGIHAYAAYLARTAAPSAADVRAGTGTSGNRIVFRSTASGAGYGMAASVDLGAPAGPRSLSNQLCDRVYAAGERISCLRTNIGILTTFEALVFDEGWNLQAKWPLPGIPSRTRLSHDGSMVATTSFVTGHSYAGTGFATETRVKALPGTDYGNLEHFRILVDGKELTAADRNVWGVTFAADGDTFYATAASGDQTWLVRGSLADRTMTAIGSNAECPSLSPDGSRVAYKKRRGDSPVVHWDIAVLDLASFNETVIRMPDSIDDQLEWLDGGTLLFGQPRTGSPGDSDIWAIEAQAKAQPNLLIEHAWSPAVVREG